jgi:hypothetical protein
MSSPFSRRSGSGEPLLQQHTVLPSRAPARQRQLLSCRIAQADWSTLLVRGVAIRFTRSCQMTQGSMEKQSAAHVRTEPPQLTLARTEPPQPGPQKNKRVGIRLGVGGSLPNQHAQCYLSNPYFYLLDRQTHPAR